MKKILLIFIISSVTIFSQSAGNTGLSFLKFGFGARNIAMGDAGTVAANDITSLFYNPSKLASFENSEVIFMHNEWVQDVRSEVFGVSSSFLGIPFALGFNVTSVDDIEARIRSGDADTKFHANYFYGSLSTGFNLNEDLAIGGTLKYLYEGMLSDEATGYAFDFGAEYQLPYEGLSVSAAVRNVGSMNNLRLESTILPAEIRFGPAYNFKIKNLKLDITSVAEYHKYFETDDNHFNIGAELFYDNIIALRVGYQSGYESRNFTFGIGLKWGYLNFDYAFLPFQLGLGSANLFSLQFKF